MTSIELTSRHGTNLETHRSKVVHFYGSNYGTTPWPHRTPPPGTTTTTTTVLWFPSTQLCILAVTLCVLVTFNAVLVLWILSHLNFETFKIEESKLIDANRHASQRLSGKLSINGGLRLDGDLLQAKSLSSTNLGQLQMIAPTGIMFGSVILPLNQTANYSMLSRACLKANKDRIVAYTNRMVIRAASDDNLLLLLQDDSGPVLGIDSIQWKGSTGLNMNGSSIQVPKIESNNQELFLYSPTQPMLIRGTRSVRLEAKTNNGLNQSTATIKMLGDRIHFHSKHRKIELNVSNIRFSDRLFIVHASKYGSTYPSIGQMCLCANSGRLFIAPPHRPHTCHTAAIRQCAFN
ncbi:hypothetical protein RDWZM_010176 [Blomia tropicalis]|uniref:Delta-sarcoglycan n=1 Tax=Blomia tropicalis TaxID=40697 RepID=A0A9Q0RIH7_BLOTA|nr:hypothetical protein RDWZM_010176 [Blomia tropicalis]